MRTEYVKERLRDIREMYLASVDWDGAILNLKDMIVDFDNELASASNKPEIIKVLRDMIGRDYILSSACVLISDSRLASVAIDTIEEDKFWSHPDEPELFFDAIYYGLEQLAKDTYEQLGSIKSSCAMLCEYAINIKTRKAADGEIITPDKLIYDEVETGDVAHSVRDFLFDGTFMETDEYVRTPDESIADWSRTIQLNDVHNGNDYVNKIYEVVLNQMRNAINYVKTQVDKGYNHNNIEHRNKMLARLSENILAHVIKDLEVPSTIDKTEIVVFKPILDVVMRDILFNSIYNLRVIYKLTAPDILRYISELKGGIVNERLLSSISYNSK